ncbi:hypothetical protein, partial [Vibrio cholerae]|uniref:hypothetical protein n=4 Tax=Vibrio cholerae TaxID=666 RepID=UPI00128218F0
MTALALTEIQPDPSLHFRDDIYLLRIEVLDISQLFCSAKHKKQNYLPIGIDGLQKALYSYTYLQVGNFFEKVATVVNQSFTQRYRAMKATGNQ